MQAQKRIIAPMKRILPIGLIAIGVVSFLGAMGWWYLDNLVLHPAVVPLPEKIANLQMTEYKNGAQASGEFERLHDKQFPLTSGAIGIYGEHEITLWAAGAPLDLMADRMVTTMRDKILQGGSPFTPVEQFNQGTRTIYVLEGLGQMHYYFQSNNLVIWLAADPAVADTAIKQILEAYP